VVTPDGGARVAVRVTLSPNVGAVGLPASVMVGVALLTTCESGPPVPDAKFESPV
jgi:hypothetical protein